jgi:SAM-dependent methyltransferase
LATEKIQAAGKNITIKMGKTFLQWLQRYASSHRELGINRCDNWAGEGIASLNPTCLLDVGCGNGSMLARYFAQLPSESYGIEGAPEQKAAAERRGMKVVSCDLNGRWPLEDNKFDAVLSSQVIEHVHNTRIFIEEIYRVLKPGGTAFVTSENLCSLLNWMALSLGYTPFSLMQVCGRYLGNPLGLHYNEPHPAALPIDHPAFSGVSGHVRVLTVRQAHELFAMAGFEIEEARSISLLPLPDGLSRAMEGFVKHRGHYLLIRARKPRK